MLVGNPVLAQDSESPVEFAVGSSGASADQTKEIDLKNYLTLADHEKATTDTPKFIITNLQLDNDNAETSELKYQDKFIASNKIKLDSSLKISDGNGKLLSAKYDKNTGKVKIILKKTAAIPEAATATVQTFNLICAFNAAPPEDQDLPGIIVIPITLTDPAKPVAETT